MFDVNSVVNKTNTLTSATSKKSGMVLNTFKCLPIKFDKPDLEKPKASAIPPTRQVRQSREVLPNLKVVGRTSQQQNNVPRHALDVLFVENSVFEIFFVGQVNFLGASHAPRSTRNAK
jgi:hypothetical protein